MTTCAYCELPATVKIPSNPGRVCVTHAVEFWTALFDVVKERAAVPAVAPPVPCRCRSCNDLTAARALVDQGVPLWSQSPATLPSPVATTRESPPL
jgi:hypothetical protein